METGSLSTIQVVLLILAAPALLILIGYGVVAFLRKQTQDAVQSLGERIQVLDGRLGQTHQFLAEYDAVNEEPFLTPVNELRERALDLHVRLEAFLNNSRAFEAEVFRSETSRLQDIINAPLNWFRRWKQVKTLNQEAQAIDGALDEGEQAARQITGLPWDLAQQCRQAREQWKEIEQTAQALQSQGVGGRGLTELVRQLPITRQALDEIPPRFYEADQEALLDTTSKKVTVQVYTVHSRVRPALDRYLPLVREWDANFQKSTAEFADLRKAGADLRQSIANPPAGLVITALQERLDQIAQMAGDIGGRLAQPEVEELKPLAREITQLRRVIQDTEQMMTRSRQQAGELTAAITEARASLEQTEQQFAQLEHRDTFPLVWDASGPLLKDLRKRLEVVGPVGQPRTPEEVSRSLKELEDIRARHKALSEAAPAVIEQHRALTALLEGHDLSEGAAWLRRSQEMLGQVAQYDPRNWSKSDNVQALPAELDALNAPQAQLVPVDRGAAVLESSLEQRLRDTQKLVGQHKALRPRVESVRSRLEKVRAMEEESKNRLTASYDGLRRVAILTETNDLLYDLSGSEIERLSEELSQAVAQLNARDQGEIEKKLQKFNALADKVNRAMNGWLAQLNTAVTEQGKGISDRLAKLDALGNLDEPSVAEARTLLQRDEYLTAMRGGTPSASTAGRLRDAVLQRQPMLGDLEVTAEIKRKADFWLTLASTHRAMEERTGALLTAYDEAVQARAETRELALEAARRTPVKRSWPPNNQQHLDESVVLTPVEERWEALKNGQPRRIEIAIQEVSRLAQQYRLASERVTQALNRIDQDEERATEVEETISELKERWQAHAQAAPNNLVIRAGVQQLMSKADERLAFIRQQYMRGAITYEEALNNLRLLNDELYSARVAVDEQNDIGLNETPREMGTR